MNIARLLPLVFAVLLLIACRKSEPVAPTPPPGPERMTLATGESKKSACGLTVKYIGGGHTIEQEGGHRSMVTFEFTYAGETAKRTFTAPMVDEEETIFGLRWKIIKANGFNVPKVTIEGLGR